MRTRGSDWAVCVFQGDLGTRHPTCRVMNPKARMYWKSYKTSWWFSATHLKNMLKSNWIVSPGIGVKIKNM